MTRYTSVDRLNLGRRYAHSLELLYRQRHTVRIMYEGGRRALILVHSARCVAPRVEPAHASTRSHSLVHPPFPNTIQNLSPPPGLLHHTHAHTQRDAQTHTRTQTDTDTDTGTGTDTDTHKQ